MQIRFVNRMEPLRLPGPGTLASSGDARPDAAAFIEDVCQNGRFASEKDRNGTFRRAMAAIA
jgi:hypothetical protein